MQTATAEAETPSRDDAPGLWPSLLTRAAVPVSAASTAFARIAFGLVVAYSSVRFWQKGWIESLYLAPAHHLTYRGFDWVRPLPAPLMYAAVGTMVMCGVAIAIGYRTRIAALTFAVVFSYCELIDAALYLNHYVYITMASLLVATLPVSTMWSLDARAGRVQRATTVPSLVVWLLRFQLAVVYLFAGVAKLNRDWLLDAQPLRVWLADRTSLPVVGQFLDEPAVAHLASWAGAAFDLTIVWLLLWRRSRPLAYVAVIVFHLATTMFQIGIFPWVMIASTPIFFSPDWPLRLIHRFRSRRPPLPDVDASIAPVPVSHPGSRRRTMLAAAIAGWVVVQLFIPARHVLIAGDVRWTEEGYYGSYRVMLNDKTGWLMFDVTDAHSGNTWRVDPALVLTSWQKKQAASRPDLLLDAAHLVAGYYHRRGIEVQVRADSWVSVNGRPRQRMVDPAVDLAALSRWSPASAYLLPFDPPVRE